jgi:hypothetical protein
MEPWGRVVEPNFLVAGRGRTGLGGDSEVTKSFGCLRMEKARRGSTSAGGSSDDPARIVSIEGDACPMRKLALERPVGETVGLEEGGDEEEKSTQSTARGPNRLRSPWLSLAGSEEEACRSFGVGCVDVCGDTVFAEEGSRGWSRSGGGGQEADAEAAGGESVRDSEYRGRGWWGIGRFGSVYLGSEDALSNGMMLMVRRGTWLALSNELVGRMTFVSSTTTT